MTETLRNVTKTTLWQLAGQISNEIKRNMTCSAKRPELLRDADQRASRNVTKPNLLATEFYEIESFANRSKKRVAG